MIALVAIVVIIVVFVVNEKNKQSSNKTNNNQSPQWMDNPWANQSNQYNTNKNPSFDSHLCDDNQHYSQLSSLNNHQSTDSITNAPLSKYEKQHELEELKDLLAAGIITQEEFSQRKREL